MARSPGRSALRLGSVQIYRRHAVRLGPLPLPRPFGRIPAEAVECAAAAAAAAIETTVRGAGRHPHADLRRRS